LKPFDMNNIHIFIKCKFLASNQKKQKLPISRY
jgi:hypothetical protein